MTQDGFKQLIVKEYLEKYPKLNTVLNRQKNFQELLEELCELINEMLECEQ